MRRFYMHFIDRNGLATDEEGFHAKNADAARRVGMRAAGQIVADCMAAGHGTVAFTLCLDDQDRKRLATLPVIASLAALSEENVATA